jgi:hypothetical protein
MFAEQLDRAGLRPLLAGLFGKGHTRAGSELAEAVIKHAIPVEIELMAIGGFEKAELAGGIEPRHGSDRRSVVLFHVALQTADLILQPPAGAFERIIDRKWQIGMAFICFRSARNVNLPAIRQGKPDVHLVQPTGQVMAPRAFEDDATGRQATESLLEIGDMLFDRGTSA